MNNDELKKLEEAHKKAMEGINAFNKEMHGAVDAMYNYFGVPKDINKGEKAHLDYLERKESVKRKLNILLDNTLNETVKRILKEAIEFIDEKEI